MTGGETAQWRPWLCAQLSSHTGKDNIGVQKEGKVFVCIALGVVVRMPEVSLEAHHHRS